MGAVVDNVGNLIVLDGWAAELRIFGTVEDTVADLSEASRVLGGRGLGPGEFQRARALSVGNSGLAAVFELNGRIHLFETAMGELEHRNTFQLPMIIEDACILNSELIVAGRHAEHAGSIHVYSMVGEWVRSFGELYRSGRAEVHNALNRTRVACLESSERILSGPVFLPEARMYDASGQVLWWTLIEELLPLYVAERANGSVTMGTPPEGYHSTVGVVADDRLGGAIVQLAFVTQGFAETGEGGKLLTYAIDLETGTGTILGEDFWAVRDLHEEGAVLSRLVPYPIVEIVSW